MPQKNVFFDKCPKPFNIFEVEGVVGDTNSAGSRCGRGGGSLLSAGSSYFGDSGIGGGWLNPTEELMA